MARDVLSLVPVSGRPGALVVILSEAKSKDLVGYLKNRSLDSPTLPGMTGR